MGLFTESNIQQVQALQGEVTKLQEANKKGSAHVAVLNEQIADLTNKLALAQAQIDSCKAAVLKARKRQKNSVERANRFKKRADVLATPLATTAVAQL
jgi:predicted  nucleic acid-binding Zn-ribbon protein